LEWKKEQAIMCQSLEKRLIAMLAVGAMLFVGSVQNAQGVLVGPIPGGPHEEFTVNANPVTPVGFDKSWTIGSSQAPLEINYLATNGLWLAQLDGSPALTEGQTIQLTEYLVIGQGGPAWTNWTQRFVTNGFEFIGGTLSVDGNLVANGEFIGINNTIGFEFAALPAGTVIEIVKDIRWAGNPANESGNIFQGSPNLIQLEQFPTVESPIVPEPATLALFGVGLSLAGAVLPRNRKKNLNA
jgi:hypothetical protein